MSDIKFTEDHEWIRMEDDDTGVCGITDYAQDQLGELVFVELPEVGIEVSQGSEAAVIESVKAAGELKAPVGGTIIEVNEVLADEPEIVNNDPQGDGWFIKIKVQDVSELDELMDEGAYQKYVDGLD
ncbi:MAG: glycine cleavage system protein GcvH [Gammaproteobacteria bacterium]|nr:glycine cleavage system protein GcvH [Gammaproteobacteria bacterium]MDH3411004.1 glycine cleavage system protein GcvH [Gammaproteobacteria bacterium]